MGNFIIENGVLEKYIGSDTYVTIPDGVTKISDYAFNGCKVIVKRNLVNKDFFLKIKDKIKKNNRLFSKYGISMFEIQGDLLNTNEEFLKVDFFVIDEMTKMLLLNTDEVILKDECSEEFIWAIPRSRNFV